MTKLRKGESMKRLWIGGSFYKKLFSSYLVILLIFIALSPLVNQYARNLTRDNELRFATSTVGYVKERFDKEVSSMKEMAYVLLDTEDEYYKQYYSNRVLNSMSIISKIGNVVGNLEAIENCYIFDRRFNSLYSADGSESESKLSRYKPLSGGSLLEAAERQKGFFYIPVIKSDGSNGVVFAANNSFGNRDVQILMPIKDGWVKGIYKNDYRIGVFMIVANNGVILASSDSERVHTSLDPEIFENLSDDASSFFTDKNWMAFSKSGQCDWYYVVETDKNLINATAKKMQIMQIFVMLATLLLGLVFIFVSSRWIYSPINKLVSRFSEDEGSDEFKAIEGTFLRLSKENEKYRREANYLQLFNRSESDTGDLSFENETFCSIVIRGLNVSKHIKALNSAELDTDNDSFRFFAVDGNEIIGLARERDDVEEIRKVMLRIKEHFSEAYGINLLIGIGNFFAGSEEFSFSLNNARYAIDYGSGSNGVIVFADNMNASCSIVIDKDYAEHRLSRAVEKGSLAEVEETVSQIFADNADIPNMFKFGLSIILVNIYSAVGRKAKRYVIDYELLMRELKNEYDNDILKAFFIRLFNGMLLEQGDEEKDGLKKGIIEKCIEENYADMNFDLGALADKLGYSTVYMTSLFKKTMGESFMQYLLDYRIEKAKELLVTTDKKIEQVASEVGFGTYNNFARAFRKKTGVSPREYRKNK